MRRRRTASMELNYNAKCGMPNAECPRRVTIRQVNFAFRISHSALLLVPQRYDRIQCGSTPRRPDAEEQPHDRAEDEGNQDGEDAYRRVPVRELGQGDRAERAEENPDHASGQTQDERLDEELEQDIEARGAQRLAHADLARPLGDGDEHDVHDADSADEQTDRRNARKQIRERLRRVLKRRQNVGLVADLEVVLAARPDLVLAPHHALDLDHGEGHLRDARRIDRYGSETVRPHDAVAPGLQGDQDLLVGVAETARRSLGGQDTDDLERDAADLDFLADHGGRIPVEHVGNRRAEHRVAPTSFIFSRREHPARREGVVLHDGIVGRGADDTYVPVLAAEFDLQVARQLRDDALDVARVAREGVRIVDRDAHALIEHDGNPAAERLPRIDGEEGRAERLETRLDGLLRPAAERHHRDDGADTDDDAQHRQERPQLVGANRLERDLEDLAEQHAKVWSAQPAAAPVWSAAAGRRASRRQ